MTFTSILEFGCMKVKAVIRFSFLTALCLVGFIFCFSPNTIILASILAVGGKVSQSIANIAYDALLDSVSQGNQAHAISSRSTVTGYSGMICFLIVAAAVIAAIYFGMHPHPHALWTEGIIPLVLTGLWYFLFLAKISSRLSPSLGQGPPLPLSLFSTVSIDANGIAETPKYSTVNDESHIQNISGGSTSHQEGSKNSCWAQVTNPFRVALFGFVRGTQMQIENMGTLCTYPDLSWFILSFIFLSGELLWQSSRLSIFWSIEICDDIIWFASVEILDWIALSIH